MMMTTQNLTSLEQQRTKMAAPVTQKELEDMEAMMMKLAVSNGGADTGSTTSPRSAGEMTHEDREELFLKVPRDETGKLMTIGSLAHQDGTCKPCVFAHNEAKPCGNGWQCKFCHFLHPPKKRIRLCKKKRMELQRLQEEQEKMFVDQVEEVLSGGGPPGLGDFFAEPPAPRSPPGLEHLAPRVDYAAAFSAKGKGHGPPAGLL